MGYKILGSTGPLVSEICRGRLAVCGKRFSTVIGSLDQAPADAVVARPLRRAAGRCQRAAIEISSMDD
jgi:hypothetical protein